MIGLIACYVIAVAAALFALARIRAWLATDRGAHVLSVWPRRLFLPALFVAPAAWLWAVLWTLLTSWDLQLMVDDPWRYIGQAALLVLMIFFVPAVIVLLTERWFRLHPIPVQWTIGRIWAVGAILLVVVVVSSFLFSPNWAAVVFATGFLGVIFTLFVTRWWTMSHPLPKGDGMPLRISQE